jgi:hypothetical protein
MRMRATIKHREWGRPALDERHAASGEGQSAIKRLFKVQGP